MNSLAIDSRWILYGLLGGPIINNFNLSRILAKRINLISTTLKTRTDDYKALLIESFSKEVLPYFFNQTIKPVVFKNYDINWN